MTKQLKKLILSIKMVKYDKLYRIFNINSDIFCFDNFMLYEVDIFY